MHTADQKLVDSIRDSITEVAEKVEGLAANQRKLQVSLIALQTYVASGLYPKASVQALHDILDLTQAALDQASAGQTLTTDRMSDLLKSLKNQKPGKA
jgi:hypothetical protein